MRASFTRWPAVILLSAAMSATASPAESADTRLQSQVDAVMQRYQGDGPGAALLVLHDGTALIRKGYGMADREAGQSVTPQTNFRLASITKQFTAACILQLAEQGKLGLDDPVRRWLPSLPPAAQPITLRHLLSHASGLIDYEDVMPADQATQLHDIDVLHLLEGQDRLYFAPGSDYRYSNSGYALLALVVGRASGMDFASYLQRHVFAPLGMADSVAYEAGVSSVPHRAYGYSEEAGRWQRTDQSTTSAVLGDGGIYSSIDDLARWDAALYDERLLSAASLQQAFAAAVATPEPDVPYYGFGWRINGDMQWHSGESIGFRNVILRFPRERMTIVLLSNRNAPEPYATAQAIATLVRDSAPVAPPD